MRTLIALRGHLVSKAAAVFLLTLILLPFTAPFATYPLDDASAQHGDGLPKDKTALKETVTPPVVSRLLLTPTNFVFSRLFHEATRVEFRSVLRSVLRL